MAQKVPRKADESAKEDAYNHEEHEAHEDKIKHGILRDLRGVDPQTTLESRK